MKQRDIGALIAAIILGFVGTFLVYVSARSFAHVGVFLIVSVFFPLLVSLVAAKKIVLIGLAPNVVMTLCLTVWLVFFEPDFVGLELIYAVSVMFSVSIFLALLVSVPIRVWRKRQARNEDVEHIFKHDSQ